MRAALEQTIEIRVERYLEVAHQGLIPNHHFAAASSEREAAKRTLDGEDRSGIMRYEGKGRPDGGKA